MKKFILFFSLFWLVTNGQGQELIACFGGGRLAAERLHGDFEFLEARLMFGRAKLQVGPAFNATWAYVVDHDFYYQGREYIGGLSLASWKRGLRLDRYVWASAGYRWSNDRGSDGHYEAWQDDRLAYFLGGWRLSDPLDGWLGDNLAMFEFQTPLQNGQITARFEGDTIKDARPFNKERLRLVDEIGVKALPLFLGFAWQEFRFTPLIHLGYGWERGAERQFWEAGAGFSFSIYKDSWYQELFKIKAFQRQDFYALNSGRGENYRPAAWQVEINININKKFGR